MLVPLSKTSVLGMLKVLPNLLWFVVVLLVETAIGTSDEVQKLYICFMKIKDPCLD
jgi:hypothetical protein